MRQRDRTEREHPRTQDNLAHHNGMGRHAKIRKKVVEHPAMGHSHAQDHERRTASGGEESSHTLQDSRVIHHGL
jgi:hypothetical protein